MCCDRHHVDFLTHSRLIYSLVATYGSEGTIANYNRRHKTVPHHLFHFNFSLGRDPNMLSISPHMNGSFDIDCHKLHVSSFP